MRPGFPWQMLGTVGNRNDPPQVCRQGTMEIPVMQPNVAIASNGTVHQRYRQLLRSGFDPQESAALVALAAGIARHAEGESPVATAWRWQEISRIEFLAHLARNERLGGPDDGGPMPSGSSEADR